VLQICRTKAAENDHQRYSASRDMSRFRDFALSKARKEAESSLDFEVAYGAQLAPHRLADLTAAIIVPRVAGQFFNEICGGGASLALP
jgi:hypothetical protein